MTPRSMPGSAVCEFVFVIRAGTGQEVLGEQRGEEVRISVPQLNQASPEVNWVLLAVNAVPIRVEWAMECVCWWGILAGPSL